ncbi:hypothetical protein PROFUN_16482 [Planoprotostelium fungivorum]|uniref:Uncharacterized protein n=1 Tax=Planoprotostelium fungivorum TaxID=1890364 RepID=A0A2P6MPW9_9EUKA|nr:hypothetical protein PROFUN_16482 [Planoprotostelium fungivorum]
MDYDLVKTFPVKRTEPKAFDELPVSMLLNYLTRDNIIELIGFPNFSSLNEQVRQQTGKVSLPAVKKMLADNEQFQAILDQNHGMMQQAYNKYLAANAKVNDLTRQQQNYIINCNKMDYDLVKTFPVKRTEPKAFDELPVSKLLNYLTRDNIIELIGFPNFSSLNEQVRQQTGKVSLPAVKKMLADNEHSRQQQSKQKQFLGCVAKHTPPEVFQKCVEQYDDPDAKYEQYKIIPYSGLRNSAYLSTISRLVKKETGPDARDRIRRRMQAAEDTESDNLKGLFDRELTTYNNKKQCMKMNNKRHEERLQELLEEKEKEYAAEIKMIQVECTSKTMSLELQLEEILKTTEQKDKFIAKQMMQFLKEYMAHDLACFTFQVQQAGKRCVAISPKTA